MWSDRLTGTNASKFFGRDGSPSRPRAKSAEAAWIFIRRVAAISARWRGRGHLGEMFLPFSRSFSSHLIRLP